jgi:hypothetical protein
MIELIYIGERFYFDSGSAMSSIYTIDGQRYDWGFVKRDLANGLSVEIRPANRKEIEAAESRLEMIKKR